MQITQLKPAQLAPDVSRPAAPPPRRSWKPPAVRWGKRAAALALLVAGGSAILNEQGYIASNDAAVSGYVVTLRSPIEGMIGGIDVVVGGAVAEGAVLARLDNARTPKERLVDVRDALARDQATLAGLAVERATLTALGEEFSRRDLIYRQGNAERLTAGVNRVAGYAAAKAAERDQASRALTRVASLSAAGWAPRADAEQAEAKYRISAREADALAAELRAGEIEAEAARRGVLVQSGGTDVTYSMQRRDEIALRLADMDREIAGAQARVADERTRLAAEEAAVALRASADIVVPGPSTVWKLAASNGERLSVGDPVAELVDCRAAFLLVSVAQDRVPDLAIGGAARFRLAGETVERTGVLRAVVADGADRGDRHLAALPVRPDGPAATAIVDFSPGPGRGNGACAVGLTARALLPTAGSAWLDRLLPRVSF